MAVLAGFTATSPLSFSSALRVFRSMRWQAWACPSADSALAAASFRRLSHLSAREPAPFCAAHPALPSHGSCAFGTAAELPVTTRNQHPRGVAESSIEQKCHYAKMHPFVRYLR